MRYTFRAVNLFLDTWEAEYGIIPGEETNLYSR
jgi:hypothetical protein